MKIRSTKPPSATNGCIYAKRINSNAYGVVSVNGKETAAHRVIWEKTYGPIPKGMLVLHRCDNPPCVNPEHLFLGTYKDNAQDRKNKGREGDRTGAKNGRTKITEQTVIRIKMMKDALTQQAIANALSLSQAYVGKVMNAKNWKQVTAQTRQTI